MLLVSALDSGSLDSGGLEKGQSMIFAYQSLAFITNTPIYQKYDDKFSLMQITRVKQPKKRFPEDICQYILCF